MTALTFHYHPLASFCWKVLIALYENATPFTSLVVDLGNAKSRDRFKALWPIAKMPVLQDDARGHAVPESTVIIEYLDRHHPGATRFIPADGEGAWQTRLWDRVYDHYLHEPMQKIVLNRLRPADGKDPLGVADAQPDRHRLWHGRTRHGAARVGDGRSLLAGRLRGGAGALLRQPRFAFRRFAAGHARLSRPFGAAAVLRPRAGGSAALFPVFPARAGREGLNRGRAGCGQGRDR